MDNDHNVKATGALDGFEMKSPDLVESSGSRNDILTRRLKNRERQRRYRARKRLEADTKRTSVIEQSSSSQVELAPNGCHYNCITPVPHKRNWKRDARRAHETTSTAISLVLASNIENEALSSAAGIVTESHIERKLHSEDSCKMDQGRRDWKAEARNKMK